MRTIRSNSMCRATPRPHRAAWRALLALPVLVAAVLVSGAPAQAAPTPIGLGTATDFAIRAGTGVSNIPTSDITGDLGLSPAAGTLYTGLTCAEVTGTIYAVDATNPLACVVEDPGLMTTAENDARTAFNHTSALPGATPTGPDLAGLDLVAGLYSFGAAATNLSGTLTLDAEADPEAVWIFQASSTLITSSSSTVAFSNLPSGVSAEQMACNVFWTVGSSATIATDTAFVGTVLASADISVLTDATVIGRLLAANAAGGAGAVTLDQNTIVRPTDCSTLPTGTGGGPAAPVPETPVPETPTTPATPVAAPPRFTG
ncbi:MAG: ice-binding family protein [Acidimicrobiales bacterium]